MRGIPCRNSKIAQGPHLLGCPRPSSPRVKGRRPAIPLAVELVRVQPVALPLPPAAVVGLFNSVRALAIPSALWLADCSTVGPFGCGYGVPGPSPVGRPRRVPAPAVSVPGALVVRCAKLHLLLRLFRMDQMRREGGRENGLLLRLSPVRCSS